jgi:hypothetical protein
MAQKYVGTNDKKWIIEKEKQRNYIGIKNILDKSHKLFYFSLFFSKFNFLRRKK